MEPLAATGSIASEGCLSLAAPEELAEALCAFPDPVFVMRPVSDPMGQMVDLTYVYVNPAAEHLYGLVAGDIVGHSQLDLFPSVRETGLLDRYAHTISTGAADCVEIPTFDENGARGAFALEFSKLRGDLLIIVRDISEQRRAEAMVAEQARRLMSVLDHSLDGIGVYGADLRFTYVNQRVVEMSGIPAATWIGSSHRELGFTEDQAVFWEDRISRVLATGHAESFTYQVDNLEGPHQWFEALLSPEFGPDGAVVHVVSTNRNVTERVEAQERLQQRVTHDELTGVMNRHGVVEELVRALKSRVRSGRLLGVLMVDLDRFKVVNDSRGHPTGDDLLVAAAERLASDLRGGDVVARTGGDEFVVVMRDLVEADEAVRAAERLVNAFREPFVIDGQEIFTTLSVGVVVAASQRTPDDLLRDADAALYAAKAQGRDGVHVFNDELRHAAGRRLTLEADLRHALDRDELEVWFQPEVDLQTGRVTAAEALARWRRPDGSVLGADQFIDLAEETRLITPIGAWVFERACSAASTWSSADGHPLTVRVNFSAVQLEDPGLIQMVRETLRTTGVDPSRVCAEITETVLLHGLEATRRCLEAMRELGMGIAIDDFGTGYASITYLSEYPVTVLKIDRAFTQHMVRDPSGRRLVSGLVALARSVGVDVTAEGVETLDQARQLRELGCPTAQGFLFSRAVPAREFVELCGRTFPHG